MIATSCALNRQQRTAIRTEVSPALSLDSPYRVSHTSYRMTTRKTYSMPDDLARSLEREAARRGLPESAIVREGMQQYLASRRTSKLSTWVGKGSSDAPLDHDDLHTELTEILAKKHPQVLVAPERKRKR